MHLTCLVTQQISEGRQLLGECAYQMAGAAADPSHGSQSHQSTCAPLACHSASMCLQAFRTSQGSCGATQSCWLRDACCAAAQHAVRCRSEPCLQPCCSNLLREKLKESRGVMSPVLSVQMVVAVPMVSAAPRWRTRLLSFSMRFTL